MPRLVLDGELRLWEAYASTGAFGLPSRCRIVFSCISDPRVRPRAVETPGDKSDVEAKVALGTDEELAELLSRASELD